MLEQGKREEAKGLLQEELRLQPDPEVAALLRSLSQGP
ncbi:hypothetical protein [Thermus caldilimi]|nr:hypothetical protein [Thermus caldilimi]